MLSPPKGRLRAAARVIAAIALGTACMTPGVAVAQDVTEPALKAAFIYNFAKFTEWPGDSAGREPFVICVLGDAAVGDALERAVKGRRLARPPHHRVARGGRRAAAGAATSSMSRA